MYIKLNLQNYVNFHAIIVKLCSLLNEIKVFNEISIEKDATFMVNTFLCMNILSLISVLMECKICDNDDILMQM